MFDPVFILIIDSIFKKKETATAIIEWIDLIMINCDE